jgi:signal transduction histidine kinase
MVFSYPPKPLSQVNLLALPKVSMVISEDRPFISDIYTLEPTKKNLIYILVPLKNRNGIIEGAIGGEIDPSAQGFSEIIRSFPAQKNTYIEIIDSHGFVIASNDSKRMFKDQSEGHSRFLEKMITTKKSVITKCHRCHESAYSDTSSNERSIDIMAYAPLETTTWGVAMLQPEKDILTPIEYMKRDFLIVSLFFVGMALVIALGMSRGIVKPVHDLIRASHKIAKGDMTKSIDTGGKDEIGKLSSSFEVMRVKLADSVNALHKYNAELEAKVLERTKQINDSRRQIKDLLKRVITSQEEERKRIAREFHDVIMQNLAATLIKIDLCRKYPENITIERIDEVKMIIEKNIDEVYRIIKNLRPSIFDDLGFEASLYWLLDQHLESKGIRCYVTISHAISNLNLDPQAEIELFRIIQEAIINIAWHSMAESVFVVMEIKDRQLNVDVEDDGYGFDPNDAFKPPDYSRGLGLIGMKERASLMNWKFNICSSPGAGTRVSVKVPLSDEVYEYT